MKSTETALPIPNISELTHQRKPEEFSWPDYADLDFYAMVSVSHARSIACLLMACEESVVETGTHKINGLSVIANLLEMAEKKVEKVGGLTSLLPRKVG